MAAESRCVDVIMQEKSALRPICCPRVMLLCPPVPLDFSKWRVMSPSWVYGTGAYVTGQGGISSQIKLITGPRNVTNWKSVFKSEHRHRLWTSSSAFRRIQVKALLIVTVWLQHVVNPLSAHENRRATDHFTAIRWSLHWVGCYIWYSEEGTARGRSPPRPLLAIRNVTAHPSTVSVPTFIRCGTIVASVP